jgi:hypothetical protein
VGNVTVSTLSNLHPKPSTTFMTFDRSLVEHRLRLKVSRIEGRRKRRLLKQEFQRRKQYGEDRPVDCNIKFCETHCGKNWDEQRKYIGPTLKELAAGISHREQLSELDDGRGREWWRRSQENSWVAYSDYLDEQEQDRRDQEYLRDADLELFTQETPSEMSERMYIEDCNDGLFDLPMEEFEPNYPHWDYGGRVYYGRRPRDFKLEETYDARPYHELLDEGEYLPYSLNPADGSDPVFEDD